MVSAPHSITYRNPVYREYFADPFVLKSGSEYFAYGTATADVNQHHFPILQSRDLVNWTYLNHAIAPIPGGINYWAPEVAEHDRRFFLFYSASASASDDSHRLRVAVAEHPAGPFRDSGRELMPDIGFSIDAHPFRDPQTGKWYLFFATDYTDSEPHGTGLAVVELNDDLTSVRGEARPIIRASCPWQIYERDRDYKGRRWKAWHCIEGPFVLFHDGKYYCLYSGGAWHSENYGLGFAVAEHPMGPYRDEFAQRGPMVLKGAPGRVIGPGHNSAVLGPDDQTQFVVYHAWDAAKTARRMCIDPLYWTADGPRCDGPSFEERTIELPRLE